MLVKKILFNFLLTLLHVSLLVLRIKTRHAHDALFYFDYKEIFFDLLDSGTHCIYNDTAATKVEWLQLSNEVPVENMSLFPVDRSWGQQSS